MDAINFPRMDSAYEIILLNGTNNFPAFPGAGLKLSVLEQHNNNLPGDELS